MSQNYAVWNDKVKFILTKKYKVSTKYANKQKGRFVHQAQFSPWNSEPNPDGNEYTPRNKDYTQKCLYCRLKTLNPLAMANLKHWFGYILCIVSIIESKERNPGGGQFISNAQSFYPHPLQTKVTNKCQLFICAAPLLHKYYDRSVLYRYNIRPHDSLICNNIFN